MHDAVARSVEDQGKTEVAAAKQLVGASVPSLKEIDAMVVETARLVERSRRLLREIAVGREPKKTP